MAMTKDEFRAAAQRHGYTLASFGEDFGVAYDTVRRWGTDSGVPRWAVRVLALMDQHGRAYVEGPAPSRPPVAPVLELHTAAPPRQMRRARRAAG